MEHRGRHGHRQWLAVAACTGALALSAGAHAQTSADDLARTHFDSGAAYLEQGEYESAVREFNAAYELSRRPEILINVATVRERMSDLPGAIEALERYLKEAPQGERAETVKLRVENLKKRAAEKDAAKAAEAPQAAPAPAPAPPPAAKPAEAPASAKEKEEASSKVPAYVLFGVGGVFAAGSILTGILAQGEHSDAKESCSPRCSDDDLATGRALAVTSTVLTGAAVVAAGIGAVFFFGSGSGDSAARSGARVAVRGAPGGISATGEWSF